MPRIKSLRTIHELPPIKGFRPLWMRTNYRQAIVLRLEEYEALRQIDYEGLIHEEVAEKMNVSRPTVTRIYEQARKKIAKALVEGRTILIEGGDVKLSGTHYMCENCSYRFIVSSTNMNVNRCPECDSEKLISLSDCFIRGCRRCRRCR